MFAFCPMSLRPAKRAQGVGRALVEAVFALAEVAGAAHVYGTTLGGNAISRILYDKIAEPLNVVV